MKIYTKLLTSIMIVLLVMFISYIDSKIDMYGLDIAVAVWLGIFWSWMLRWIDVKFNMEEQDDKIRE